MLVPSTCRLIPDQASRRRAFRIVRANPPEKFQTYADWFYFLHVDPVQRLIHLVGMICGTYVFYRSGLALVSGQWGWGFLLFWLGGAPFYGFGVVSHYIYDQGAAKSDPAYWRVTLFTVVYINLATLFGFYEASLRAFVKKYPFVADEWQLIEMSGSEFLRHLLRPR